MSVHELRKAPVVVAHSLDDMGFDNMDFWHPDELPTGKSVEELEAENTALKRHVIEGRVILAQVMGVMSLLTAWSASGEEFNEREIVWGKVG